MMAANVSYIRTIRERCRVCYTCVRECPAKAIRIADGQAEIIPERCINCGNCVRVCSQNAKQVISSVDEVAQLLDGPTPVSACLAPSFPAAFSDIPHEQLIGMLRRLGFTYVNEVAFGADIVAHAYTQLLKDPANKDRHFISTPCPAIISYVEKYFPDQLENLVPIVSPMVATGRVLHEMHGRDLKVVFIGPCIAKKCEAADPMTEREIDSVLTFVELRELFEKRGITPADASADDFDPPRAGLGALFPISRGLLQAAEIDEDLISNEVVSTDGRDNFVQAIKEFAQGDFKARLLELLSCNGCIMGAHMSTQTPLFTRREQVSHYVRQRQEQMSPTQRDTWKAWQGLDLSRPFDSDDQRIHVPFEEEIRQIMAKMGKFRPEDELNCGACGYNTCYEHAEAIFKGLAETEMCLPNTIEQLRHTVDELGLSNDKLARTREALKQSEKLASMGQLAAGIAHEVNNPLGVVLMYAHLLMEENQSRNPEMGEDLQMIVDQADRCKKIVSGLLHFARQNKVELQPVDLNELLEQVARAVHVPASITLEVSAELADPTIEMDPDQVIQVITNMINNAQAAMPSGGTIRLETREAEHEVTVAISDTGVGIPEEHRSKLFEPFFSTKKVGTGTGLGLAVTYGIIKMHRGRIEVESNADPAKGPTGTTFLITLPRHAQKGGMPEEQDNNHQD